MLLGRDQIHHPGYSRIEKAYIAAFGVPIVGLRIRARNVFSLIPKNRQYARILDAGSGTGVFSFELGRRFPEARVVGVDFQKEVIEACMCIAEKTGATNVEFRQEQIENLRERNTFDLILCVDILEHIEDDLRALRGLSKAAVPGGILVLHVPALYRRYPVWKKSLNFEVETHFRVGYRPREIREKVRKAGFLICESGFTYGFWETLANNLSYMITQARMQNKILYSLAFPVLISISLLGARARPRRLGAGIFLVAEKREPKMDCNKQEGFDVFSEIADFWSFQLNNEIYLRDRPGVIRGSKEYFEIILAARRQFIYYFPTMISYLKKAPSRNLLEVGCGMGTDSLVFAQEGFDITGIDLAPAHLELAEGLFKHYHLTGSFMEGNAENLPFPDHRFGCVYSFGVLHHTPNTGKAIQEIYRVLSPEGRAVIMLYHKWSLNNFAHWILRKGFENVRNGNDAPVTYRFSKAGVRKMCNDFSSCDIKMEYLFGAGWGKIYDIVPQSIYLLLSKIIGWHLVIYLRK